MTHINYENYDDESRSEYDVMTSDVLSSKLDPAGIKAIHTELMIIHRYVSLLLGF